MTANTTRKAIDADELTLLVSDSPDARAYRANPIDLSDPVQARETLTALRGEGETVLVGIEFDDPCEPGNRTVLTRVGNLAALEFFDDRSQAIPFNEVLGSISALAGATIRAR